MFSYFETSLKEKATNIKKGGSMPKKKVAEKKTAKK